MGITQTHATYHPRGNNPNGASLNTHMPNTIPKHITELISSEGKITFARFMEIALYDPESGYYSSAAERIGRDGDFYTSPDVHPFVGRVLGAQLITMWRLLGKKRFGVIEMGAGKGVMAADILEYIKVTEPGLYNCLTYNIIEKSKAFRARQSRSLDDYGSVVRWLDSLSSLDKDSHFSGCILSNEFVDALPFHRVYQGRDGLKEVYVTRDRKGELAETIGELSTNRLAAYIDRLGIALACETRTEINLEAMNWIRDVSGILDEGFVLTIDYGFPAHLYYDPSRTDGTFICYHKHTTNEEPFKRIGRQDITAHVDFTSLALEGVRNGLSLAAYTNLPLFLTSQGREALVNEIENLQQRDQVTAFKGASAIKNLIHPEGMGGKFKVMLQAKNVNASDMIEDRFNKRDALRLP